MALDETSTDHVRGEDFFTLTVAETWSIAMVKRLRAKYPAEVDIRHTNPDGSMVVRMPFEWMRVVPKREDTSTDELRTARRERMAALNSLRRQSGDGAIAPNSDEQAPPHTGIPPRVNGAEIA